MKAALSRILMRCSFFVKRYAKTGAGKLSVVQRLSATKHALKYTKGTSLSGENGVE